MTRVRLDRRRKYWADGTRIDGRLRYYPVTVRQAREKLRQSSLSLKLNPAQEKMANRLFEVLVQNPSMTATEALVRARILDP